MMRRVVRAAWGLAVAFALSAAAPAFEPIQQSDENPLILASRVKEVMHRFGVAVKKKDMLGFHGSVVMSATLAEQYSTEKMNAAFKPLMDSGVDLTKLDSMQPLFDAPLQVDAINQLIVKGHYASAPPTVFEMRFIREGGHLGLSFVDVHVSDHPLSAASDKSAQPVPGATPKLLSRSEGMPDAATVAVLKNGAAEGNDVELPPEQMTAVRAAMRAFALAVKHKNMDQFLQADIVSHLWGEHQTAAQLSVAYRNELASGGDFTLLDQLVPVIPATPHADDHGGLDISGYYAAPDSRIAFRMGFVDEAGTLRLINFAILPARAVHRPAKP